MKTLRIQHSAVGVYPLKALLITFFALTAFLVPAVAQNSTSEVDELLDLLLAKGIITSAEASALRVRRKNTAGPEVGGNPVATALVSPAPTAPQPVPSPSKGDQASSKNKLLNISGFVQARFTEARGTTNTFEIRRARLIFDGNLSDQISYYMQLDGVKPQMLDAKVDFKGFRQFGATIGQFKIPFSTESMTSDNLLPFIERSPVDNLYAPGRENG